MRALASISSTRQHRPQLRAPARVADARREVADDQHDDVAGVLEVAQLAQHDRVAEVDVGRGRVDPQLDAQRAPERELALELARRQHLGGAAHERLEGVRRHAANARLPQAAGAVCRRAPPRAAAAAAPSRESGRGPRGHRR